MTGEPRDIPGWEPCEPGNEAAQQIVDGQWYFPLFGCDSLEVTLDGVNELRQACEDALKAFESMYFMDEGSIMIINSVTAKLKAAIAGAKEGEAR